MKIIKIIPFAFLMLLIFASQAISQDKTDQGGMRGPATVSQAKFAVSVKAGEYDLLSVILEFPPGSGMPAHMHGGPVTAIVLSGEITLREKGTARTIKQGGSWTENAGDEHEVANEGSTTARVAVSMFLPKGAEATTIVGKK